VTDELSTAMDETPPTPPRRLPSANTPEPEAQPTTVASQTAPSPAPGTKA